MKLFKKSLLLISAVVTLNACDNPNLGQVEELPDRRPPRGVETHLATLGQSLSCDRPAHSLESSIDGNYIIGACHKFIEGIDTARLMLFRCPRDGQNCQEVIPNWQEGNNPELSFEYPNIAVAVTTRKLFIEIMPGKVIYSTVSPTAIAFYDFDRQAGDYTQLEAVDFAAPANQIRRYLDVEGNPAVNPNQLITVAMDYDPIFNRLYVLANQKNEEIKLPSVLYTFHINDKGGTTLIDTKINPLSYDAVNMVVSEESKIYILNSDDDANFARNSRGDAVFQGDELQPADPIILYYLEMNNQGLPGNAAFINLNDRITSVFPSGFGLESTFKKIPNNQIVLGGPTFEPFFARLETRLYFLDTTINADNNDQVNNAVHPGNYFQIANSLGFFDFEVSGNNNFLLNRYGQVSRYKQLEGNRVYDNPWELGFTVTTNLGGCEFDPEVPLSRNNDRFNNCLFTNGQMTISSDNKIIISVKNQNFDLPDNFTGLVEIELGMDENSNFEHEELLGDPVFSYMYPYQ